MAIPQGLLSLDRENVFLGVLPKLVVIALVHSEAYHGSYAKNAFNFHHYKVTQVALSVNGETRKPIQVQFGDAGIGVYIRGTYTFSFVSFLANNCSKWTCNPRALQSPFSSVCGHFCIYNIFYRCRNISMSTIVYKFTRNLEQNDELVAAFVRKMFPVFIRNMYSQKVIRIAKY